MILLRAKIVFVLPVFFLFLFLFSQKTLAAEFEVQNEYPSGIGYTALLPQDQGVVAIPFKVGSEGSYKDFQFMLQQSYYVGRSYGFPASTPYFDPVSQYPTDQYFQHVKMAVLPSNHSSTGPYPTAPDFAVWRFYGDVTKAVGVGTHPTLLEPEIIRDSTRYKWLQFNLGTGVNLSSSNWYWLVLFTDSNPDALEEWEFTGMKVVTEFSKANQEHNNFGVTKGWHSQLGWFYLNSGEYIGFRIASSLPAPVTKTPLVIIPGIGGSEFKANEDFQSDIKECGDEEKEPYFYRKDEVIWVNLLNAADIACDDYFDALKLQNDGQTPQYPNVVLNGSIYSNTYLPLIQYFQNEGYELNKSLFIFPYDWRKDVSLTSPLFHNLITSIKTQTGKDKVDVVAHSMGGLVARKYIAESSNAGNVRKLITLGTPYLGSVEALKTIMYGNRLGPEIIFSIKLFGIQSSETKDIFQNLTGGYSLLPTHRYYEFYDGSKLSVPKPFEDRIDIDLNNITGDLGYSDLKSLMSNIGLNTSLQTYAENFHASIEGFNQTGGVDISHIVGSGIETNGKIIEKYLIDFAGLKIPTHDLIKINGDKSVPLFSASLNDSTRGISLFDKNKTFYTQVEHSDLPKSSSVHEWISNILNGSTSLPEGIQTTPIPLEGQQVSVHSPVEIHAYDSLGNHTGPTSTGDFETNIPGSSYDTLEDSKFIWLPKDGTFTVRLEATDDGRFDLKIREYSNDVNIETKTFQQISVQDESKGEVTLNTNIQNPVINLDRDGDNTYDQQIQVTSTLDENQVTDNQVPNTSISLVGTKGDEDWYKTDVTVTLTAQDDKSGILKTEYTMDGGTTIQTYSIPFTISNEGISNLRFMSTDKAGNTESPQSQAIKIDKNKPTVTIKADPAILWPPLFQFVKVKISGSANDSGSGIVSKVFEVEDEYNHIEPKITDFGQYVWLHSWRRLTDWNGRVYKIKVNVTDVAGNSADSVTNVLVPYFKR